MPSLWYEWVLQRERYRPTSGAPEAFRLLRMPTGIQTCFGGKREQLELAFRIENLHIALPFRFRTILLDFGIGKACNIAFTHV